MTNTQRSKFILLLPVVALAVFVAPLGAGAQTYLDASTLTKYLDPLPNPFDNLIAPAGSQDGATLYEVSISQFQQKLHSELPPATLWGYNGMYPGPTFEVNRDETIKVRWTNDLVDGMGQPLMHFLPYDPTLHGAGYPDEAGGDHGSHSSHGGASAAIHEDRPPFPQARTVTHLHGAVVEAASDGYPEHWFTPDPNAASNGLGGPAGNQWTTTYTNPQRAAGMWYHDHAMGITRLNVYAGLAGFYFIRDDIENALNLPSGDYEVPLMIADKSFYDDGSLFYPGIDPDNPDGPGQHVSTFRGDANLVNGVVWPFMEVEPRKYRFRMLNSANTRAYTLSVVPDPTASNQDPMTLHHIGTDGGLFATRIDVESVALLPSDRADVIVDFSQYQPGDTLKMMNSGLLAFEGTTDQVMEFRVVPSKGPDTSSLPLELSTIERYNPADAVLTRHLELVRGFDNDGNVRLMLDGKRWDDPVSEVVQLHELEIWEIANTTGEAHPIHLHLEAFQILSKTTPFGEDIPLEPNEMGWEDTFTIKNGEIVRFMVKYDKYAGQYVWHCHILEHEDHEMMRPLLVVPEPASVMIALAAIALYARRFSIHAVSRNAEVRRSGARCLADVRAPLPRRG